MVYGIPCSCGKVYIGETKRILGTKVKEHSDACMRCFTDRSAITEYALCPESPYKLEQATVLNCAVRTT